MTSVIYALILIQLLGFWIEAEATCPDIPNCVCPENKYKHLKLKCSHIHSVDALLVIQKYVNVTTPVYHLDLSNNSIRELPADSFPINISMKLNLDKNNMETIHDDAFRGLPFLKKLVLSNNKLRELRRGMFEGLDSVDHLKLNQNFLSVIPNDTFDSLPALKQLDISSNPLFCSCDVWWLLSSTFKLSVMPKCDSPPPLRGQLLDKALSTSECSPVYSFVISPDQNQIVFEGDSLRMMCVLSGLGRQATAEHHDQLLAWKWEGRNPNSLFDNASQYQDINGDNGTVESTLIISELYEKHSGEWSCNSLSPKFNRSLSVRVNVLSKDTLFCEVTVTENDKGRYTWPETVAGHVVELPCEMVNDSPVNMTTVSTETVSHFCSNNGSWMNLNSDRCPFTSSVTRILQNFSKMNLTNHKASLIESATNLRNYTVYNFNDITHVKDIHFIVTTMENYIKFLEEESDLGDHLLGIVSSVLTLPKSLMERAQQQHLACLRLLSTIEAIIKYCPSLEYTSKEFALVQASLSSDSFLGITCSWIKYKNDLTLDCSMPNKTLAIGPAMEISVHIAINILHQLETKIARLATTMFNDSRMFPDRNTYKESSTVIGINFVNFKVNKLEEPVTITVKNVGFFASPTLAWWNSDKGVWSRDACQLTSSFFSPYLKYTCDRLGYFSLMTEFSEDPSDSERNVQQRLLFHFLHWSVYVGTFIGVTCLLLASATYCFCYTHIQMSRKMKHSLMNSWFSASLLFLIFSVGIHQTDHELVCQSIGLLLHYFALATLFWMAVTIKALYKRVQKSNRSVSTPSEDLPPDIPIEKPILGIYLIGWGISAIICGIAGAVNIHGYSGLNYCFLSPGPGLYTVFIPASVVMFYLLIMCLLVKCAASNVDSNPQLSVGTQAIDLELLEGCGINGMIGGRNSYTHEGCNSVRSITTPSSQAEDTEHSPVRQLKAFIIFWTFYSLATASAAACVMQPLPWLSYEEKLYSVMYAVVCLLLGAFILFFHCFARSDVRSAWSRLLNGKSHRKTPHIIANSFMPSAPTAHTLTSDRMNGPIPGDFDGQGGTLNKLKNSVAVDNRSIRSDFLKQTPNINLFLWHRQHYRGCSTLMADGNFYNPHQSIVAKKFFKKQRRKRNNTLQVRKCRSGGSSPVSSTLLFDNDKKNAMKMSSTIMRHDEVERCDDEENMQFLRRQNVRDDRYDEFSSEKHPLTYDDPDMTGCEEGKTGTESEATFTVPEYAEIPEQNSAMIEHVPPRIPTKEQMCGPSDHEWCSCDTISDVNSEPTYNYAYIRNGYTSSRSVISDNSSGNSHMYTAVVADNSNSVDRYRNRTRSRTRPPRNKVMRPRQPRSNYYRPPSKGTHQHHDDYSSEFSTKNSIGNGDFRKRRKDEGYQQLTKDTYRGVSPSSDFSSEDKVETCV